jgi:very-short-patch-repair endonuclease
MRSFRHISIVAARQHGVVRTRQTGMGRSAISRAVAAGLLHRRYRGVYAYGNPELSREGEWVAAVFAAGEGAGLTGVCAGVAWEVSRFTPTRIEVLVPKRRRAQAGFELVVGGDPRDLTGRNRVPVCTLERMLIDLTDSKQPEQIANVIHEAAFRRCFSVDATRRAMARTAKRRMGRLERAIEMHLAGSVGTRSELEDEFMRLVRSARLPQPVINTRVSGVEVDFRWGGFCVEVDGPGHLRRASRDQDAANQAILRAHGLTVVRFTDADLEREPGAVIHRCAAAARREHRRMSREAAHSSRLEPPPDRRS